MTPKTPKQSKTGKSAADATKLKTPKLIVRNATVPDAAAICALAKKIYTGLYTYTLANIKGQINNYPEGQFVAEFEGQVVGYCCTVRVKADKALGPHTWRQISGNGYGATHDEEGDFLYGLDIFVDPGFRGLRIGERLYDARKKLCQHLRLRGIVFGGRMPLLSKRIKKYETADAYIEAVKAKAVRDPVLSFQMRRGFQVVGVLAEYWPEDTESLGYASHMVWYNPSIPRAAEQTSTKKYGSKGGDVIRVATVQYQQRRIASFAEFEQIVTYFVDVVADYHADFVVFPELFTLQLLSIENEAIPPDQAIDHLTRYTDQLRDLFNRMAIRYNVNIIAGSHPTKVGDQAIENIAFVCLRDGSVHQQAKIHPTPNERYWWNIQGSDSLEVIETDCGPIGVLICYDSEFPELARHLVDQGAVMLFVPFCTDERQSYLRVRYSCQARAVENQCFMVLSGNVGNLPMVNNMELQYAQSCILTPCDFPFSRDGIAADTTPNVETVAFADLRLENLYRARNNGTVQNLRDRRHDLYSVVWHK
ncbi:MAG: GNAT family N-acetyltransferase [Vampirovibrionales bacterium]